MHTCVRACACPQAPTGIPKVEVSLKLSNEKTLQAVAVYKQGNKTRQLVFQAAKNGPPLRAVTQLSEAPED